MSRIHQTYADFNLHALFQDLKQAFGGKAGSQAFGGKAGVIPAQTTELLPQHQGRGGRGTGVGSGGVGSGGGKAGESSSAAVGQKRSRSELDTEQKKLRKQLQHKLQRRSKGKPSRKLTLAIIDQAARDLEIVNGLQGQNIFREDQIYQHRAPNLSYAI